MADETHAPSRLVMVDVLWARWGPLYGEPDAHQPWHEHTRFLHALLRPAPDARPDADIRARPRSEQEVDKLLERAREEDRDVVDAALADLGRAHLPGGRWRHHGDAATAATRIADGMRVVSEHEGIRKLPRPLREALLDAVAHRVHLEGPQLARLHPPDGGRAAPVAGRHACLDFRLRYQLDTLWLFATLSLWSDRPRSEEHAPRRRPGGTAVQVASFVPWAQDLRDDFRDQMHRRYPTIEASVLEPSDQSLTSRYRPPRFWVAMCTGERGKPCALVDDLSRRVLSVPPARSRGVARETLEITLETGARDRVPAGGDLRVVLDVVRRLKPLSTGAAPAYVVVLAAASGRQAVEQDQEDAVQALIARLTALESDIAADMLDITTDLDIDQGFADLYHAIADRGAQLWDQLAMRLPEAHGEELEDLHQLIELIHLTLLQGLADLDHLQGKAARSLARVGRGSDVLLGQFEAEFHGIPTSDGISTSSEQDQSLADSLRCAGYVAPTRHWAERVATDTAGVRADYASLLGAISQAFDERRVRETDKIGRYGLALAVALTVVTFVSETYGQLIEPMRTDVTGLVFAAVLVAVVVGGRQWYRRRFTRIGGLDTSEAYRRHYRQVREYLSLCRTDRLDQIEAREADDARARIRAGTSRYEAWSEYYRRWNEIDGELADRFATLVDTLREHHPGRRGRLDDTLRGHHPGRRGELDGLDPDTLKSCVETWSLWAVLAGERPRSFYTYPLPRLMLLYRCVPAPPRAVRIVHGGRPPDLVSRADMRLTLRGSCEADIKDVDAVTAWGRRLRRRAEDQEWAARRVLEEVEDTGIRAGMCREAWPAVCRRLGVPGAGSPGAQRTSSTTGAPPAPRSPQRNGHRPERRAVR